MPKTQRVIWTALPNGVAGNTLRLSVFVSPRLYNSSDTKLNPDFPDFLDWPKKINQAKFTVEFKGGPKLSADFDQKPPNVDPAADISRDSGVWQTIFKGDTFVRAYRFADLSKRVIRSFPVSGVMGYLKGLYTNAAQNSPTVLPHLKTGKGDED